MLLCGIMMGQKGERVFLKALNNKFQLSVITVGIILSMLLLLPMGCAYRGQYGVIMKDMEEITDWKWLSAGDSVGLNDPVLFVEPHREYPYRMYVHSADGGQDLYKSKNMVRWQKIADNVIPSGAGTSFSWGRIGPDGKYYLYRTIRDEYTELWVGKTLIELENKGMVLDESDTGGYYDPEERVWHIYYEAKSAGGPHGDAIGHAVSSDGVNWKKVGIALDVSDKPWHTGDPDIIRVGKTYHMFIDRTASEHDHTRYYIAWATSEDLNNFKLRDEKITDWYGGDACVRFAPTESRFFMYQEFYGADSRGVGYATMPVPSSEAGTD